MTRLEVDEMTDQQREQLARLAVGGTTVLMDEVEKITNAVPGHPNRRVWAETLANGAGAYDAKWVLDDLLSATPDTVWWADAPHGKVGDEFTATIRDESLSPEDWHGQSFEGTFRIKSVEFFHLRRGAEMPQQVLQAFVSKRVDYGDHLWLTEVERTE